MREDADRIAQQTISQNNQRWLEKSASQRYIPLYLFGVVVASLLEFCAVMLLRRRSIIDVLISLSLCIALVSIIIMFCCTAAFYADTQRYIRASVIPIACAVGLVGALVGGASVQEYWHYSHYNPNATWSSDPTLPGMENAFAFEKSAIFNISAMQVWHVHGSNDTLCLAPLSGLDAPATFAQIEARRRAREGKRHARGTGGRKHTQQLPVMHSQPLTPALLETAHLESANVVDDNRIQEAEGATEPQGAPPVLLELDAKVTASQAASNQHRQQPQMQPHLVSSVVGHGADLHAGTDVDDGYVFWSVGVNCCDVVEGQSPTSTCVEHVNPKYREAERQREHVMWNDALEALTKEDPSVFVSSKRTYVRMLPRGSHQIRQKDRFLVSVVTIEGVFVDWMNELCEYYC